MNHILFASPQRFRDTPHSVKTQYVLGQSNGGGDGMNFGANDVFVWSSESVPAGLKPRHIITLWVDASAASVVSPNNNVVTIKTSNGQILSVQAGSQGFFILTMNAPFTLTVSATVNTGQVNITAYDYNALFTGTQGNGGVAVTTGNGGAANATPSVPSGARPTPHQPI